MKMYFLLDNWELSKAMNFKNMIFTPILGTLFLTGCVDTYKDADLDTKRAVLEIQVISHALDMTNALMGGYENVPEGVNGFEFFDEDTKKANVFGHSIKLDVGNGSQTVLVNYTTSNPQACSSIVEFYVSMRPKDDKGEIIKHNPDGSPFIPRYDVACDSEVLILAKS